MWGKVLVLLASLTSAALGNDAEVNEPEFMNSCVTYDDLGEFCTGYPFYDPPYRPVSYLPQSPEEIDTRFRLFTLTESSVPYLLVAGDSDNVANSNFDATKKTYLIIHGYLDQGWVSWIEEMKDEFLKKEDCNVIGVNWGAGSIALYAQATANTRVVGAEIAKLVNYLISDFSGQASQFHIFGHSLGAHTAGYAGSLIPGLGRITGMDPAEPYFEHCSPDIRLDPTDAEFVDAIHTDGKSIFLFGLGMWEPCAHIDIYPNGGRDMPGCDDGPVVEIWVEGLVEGVRQFIACNHHFAVYMSGDSINSVRPDVAYECTTWSDFVSGRCTDCGADGGQCCHYGFKAGDYALGSSRHEEAKFWMHTRETPPFGMYHHNTILHMHASSSEERGHLYANIVGTSGQSGYLEITDGSSDLKPSDLFNRMTAAEHPLGSLLRIEFKWEYDYDWYKPWDWPIFNNPEIQVVRILVLSLEDQIEQTFCSPGGNLEAGNNYLFYPC